jgi:hypothetical protein
MFRNAGSDSVLPSPVFIPDIYKIKVWDVKVVIEWVGMRLQGMGSQVWLCLGLRGSCDSHGLASGRVKSCLLHTWLITG